MWVQTNVVPGVEVPVPRGVFYRSGANAVKLGSFMLWAEFVPRWESWPFYAVGAKNVAMAASPVLARVSEPTPTLIVQGWDADAGWQLVKISRATDHRELRLKRKGAFSRDFMSDSVFDSSDLRPFTVAAESDRSFTVRPSVPLEMGEYAMCGQLPGGGTGWLLMRQAMTSGVAMGCTRMEWQTPRWNEPAARFYAKHGALERIKRRFYLWL